MPGLKPAALRPSDTDDHGGLGRAVARAGRTAPRLTTAAKLNFISLALALILGTAGLPHVLMRLYTVPNAQEARRSIVWTVWQLRVLPLDNPGIVSIPLAFFLGWLGSVTDRQPSDPARFARIQVRALTGVGAERGSHG
jgi:Na+(H+)/acetate symporter ActP